MVRRASALRQWWPLACLAALTSACSASDPANGDKESKPPPANGAEAPTYRYRVVNVFPHDPQAFTQGLVWADGALYEGTGLEGRSSLRKVELETGRVLQSVALDAGFFGEGIALLGDRIYQLTWQSRVAFLYDRDDFSPRGQLSYPTEGWGLTTDGEALIMSDGTAALYRRDPTTFAELGRLEVHSHGQPIRHLNELEWVEGEVWANIWGTDRVALIDPDTGEVKGWVALDGLLTSREQQQADVLNGIAYDPAGRRLFVTGKLWPWLFQVELAGPS